MKKPATSHKRQETFYLETQWAIKRILLNLFNLVVALGIDTYKHTLVGLYWCMFLITTTFNFFVEAFFKYESNFNTRKLLHVQQFSRSSWFMLQWRSDLLEYSFRSFPLCLIEHLKPFDGFAHVGKRKPYNNFWPINIGYDCQLKIVDVSSFLFYFISFLKLCNTCYAN